ncbi:MAG TPA: FkbM family methyltransferase [Rhodanobacteraceae bacterium]|nr:FkbM family methyltransferase [Rhodanobacteraceae bacterium]
MKDLDRLRRVWHALGREDPLWAVLSQSDKRGRRWRPDEFLETGRVEIATQLHLLALRGLPVGRSLALDFGCGAGRLSRALAPHFDHVVGLDVSASMVETARALNADVANVEFRENASPRLEGIADASVDLVYSNMTLQHIPSALAAGYVEEFLRVLAPGGVAAFQFVAGADRSLRGHVFARVSNRWLNPLRRLAWRRNAVFEMHALDEALLAERLAAHPALELVEAVDDAAAGPGWLGRKWIVVNRDEIPVEIAASGYRLYARGSDTHIGAQLIAGRVHDANVEAALRAELAPGDTLLDIGANIGVFTMLGASLVGDEGRVIAVEPISRNADLIERACRANRYANVAVIRAAASDRAGEIELRTHASTSNSATPAAAGERLRADGGVTVRVPAVVLDDALGDLDRLDLVKVDAAGMEPRALRGLERLLDRWRPVLVAEFHPWAIERATGDSPLAFLEWLGRWYGAITVLHGDGSSEDCAEPGAVMRIWRGINEAAGADGRIHLDLLLRPRVRQAPRSSASAAMRTKIPFAT